MSTNYPASPARTEESLAMRPSRLSIVLALVLSLCAGRMPAQQATTATGLASRSIDPKQQAIPPVGKFVTVFGAKIHYVDVGSGPSVILLHCLADDIGR